jgi:ATP-dependent RNA helicase RhlE
VQRITQVIHPVARGKKKALLAHIIQEQNWSQVLVFTRTKFGANNVAEYLTKNGIQAMALHGNKSQAARTQALGGFKSGDIRALVATDIAARGIDIDDLPHVVNYEIPNVSEDYVHRIGRTGRAGADGAAVNLVCLDEEGFMQDIERFTRQQIAVKIIEGFMPEPGEKAEPIAMGRQTIWGGAGKPPSREVMQAAAKAARTEMMQRVRDNRATQGERGGNGRGGPRGSAPHGDSPARGPRPATGRGRSGSSHGSGYRDGTGQPDHNRTASGANLNPAPRAPHGGQPDPMRTSVDSMTEQRGRRNGGGFGGGNRNGGSYGRTGSGAGGFGGRGNGSRGPGGSRGSFGR